ncbi:hypothetical protein YW5DRAFT_01556 [Streptomyces sp. Ncost-T6T-1]|nr:hypothetical protein YW5DRAFT_01556 [Streptomyces sp. Ncost-T6T-1]
MVRSKSDKSEELHLSSAGLRNDRHHSLRCHRKQCQASHLDEPDRVESPKFRDKIGNGAIERHTGSCCGVVGIGKPGYQVHH